MFNVFPVAIPRMEEDQQQFEQAQVAQLFGDQPVEESSLIQGPDQQSNEGSKVRFEIWVDDDPYGGRPTESIHDHGAVVI